MLVRPFPRLIVVLVPLFLFGFFVYRYNEAELQALQGVGTFLKGDDSGRPISPVLPAQSVSQEPSQIGPATAAAGHDAAGSATLDLPSADEEFLVDTAKYHEVFSVSKPDRKYFKIELGGYLAYNPNIIPHPTRDDTWIIVAQQEKYKDPDGIFAQLSCNAVFINEKLTCFTTPAVLPIAATNGGGHCTGNLAYFNLASGPHDARLFYGPDNPYTIYGSNSHVTCFGQWIQDFRGLIEDFGSEALNAKLFRDGTEIQRPAPYGAMEKNFFIFWDTEGKPYAHYDVAPKRVFAQLFPDGAVGEDLAPQAADKDHACMARYMPTVDDMFESIHQATNSLLITLCKRADPTCQASESNTFVMTIFQHKSFYNFHSVYEPYVMLFKQTAPFEVHSISQKPLWIHGRAPLTPKNAGIIWADTPANMFPKNQSEMFYVTSMSWKAHGQKYHGYMDDVLFLAFGIEDSRTGAIDVLADDIVANMGVCGPLL